MPSLFTRTLVVGSHEGEFALLRDLLSEIPGASYEMHWVSDFGSALQLLASKRHDVCLLHERVGDREGLELLNEAIENRFDIPIVFLADREDYQVDLQVMKAGAADYLVKQDLSGPRLERSLRYAVERKRTERILKKSEQKYRELVEGASNIIIRLDNEARITFVNEFTEAFFGYFAHELLGRSVVGTIVPQVDSEGRDMEALLREALANPESYTRLEAEVRRKSGDRAWVVWTSRVFRTREGTIDGFLSVGTDVTDQRRAEARISLDDARFEVLFQLSRMTETSIDDLEDYALEQAVRISGSSLGFSWFLDEGESRVAFARWSSTLRRNRPPEALPLSFPLDKLELWSVLARKRDALIINDWAAMQNPGKSSILDGIPLHRLMAAPVVEGDRIVAITLVGNKQEPYEESDARHLGLLMSSMWRLIRNRRDRDALSQSEQQLRETNTLLQRVFDGISEPLVMLNKDFSVSMLNRAARKYYGLGSDKDIRGRLCYEALCRRGVLCEECCAFLAEDVPAATFERQGIFDSNRFEQVVIYSVYGEDGVKDASIVRISDITERRTIQKQLLQSEKLASLGLLVSGITHEINNPNTFISFNLPILRDYLTALMPIFDEYADQHPDLRLFHMPYARFRADLFKLLDNMEHGSSRISGIVSSLKSFLRKRDTTELQKTDIGSLIEQTVSLSQPEIRKTVKSLHVIVPDGLPEITTDPEAVQQVILNLLINAAQACDKPESEVSLRVGRVSAQERGLFIEVHDNGVGMDDSVKKRIFDPFFTTKGRTSGTGLGLYLCYNLMHNLGGTIEVASTPGQGSTFRVVLTDHTQTEVP